MAGLIRKLFGGGAAPRLPALPDGERVYAIGDIHGRLDLLEALAEAIERDDAASPARETTVILLGDLVDRGPDSAGVVRFARQWAQRRDLRFISGNHEEMFLHAFLERNALKGLLRFGGIETLRSYGLEPEDLLDMEFEDARQALDRAVPKEDRQFLRGFELMIRKGDYLFVHAGIHPRVPLDQQNSHDCRWIREPFLRHTGDHGCFVVHGHTITAQADLRANRIGIDTGAYDSGVLSALRLEGSDRRLIQTEQRDAAISVHERGANCIADLHDIVPGSL
jgi:serine/threonine protein phosphatase 1